MLLSKMSQADVVSAMRQKDIEKTLALEEIKTAEVLLIFQL